MATTLPKSMPSEVAAAIADLPRSMQERLLQLRTMIFEAAKAKDIGPVEETLKWGEPAYVPGKHGTTIRLSGNAATGNCKMLVHCQTSLVDEWRGQFGSRLTFEGNRAVVIDPEGPLPIEELSMCIASALTYHADRQARSRAHG